MAGFVSSTKPVHDRISSCQADFRYFGEIAYRRFGCGNSVISRAEIAERFMTLASCGCLGLAYAGVGCMPFMLAGCVLAGGIFFQKPTKSPRVVGVPMG